MSWQPAIYVQFPNEETARAMASTLGVDFPATGEVPSGNQNYALHAPMMPPWSVPPVLLEDGTELVPGTPEPGYWAMLRLNDAYAGYAAIMAALESAGVVRTLEEPPTVWA